MATPYGAMVWSDWEAFYLYSRTHQYNVAHHWFLNLVGQTKKKQSKKYNG